MNVDRRAIPWWFARIVMVVGIGCFGVAAGCSAEGLGDVGGGGTAGARNGTGAEVFDERSTERGWPHDELEGASNLFDSAAPSSAIACTLPSQCGSGFCVDGVCCDVACTGICQGCTAAKKGSGVDGTCGFIGYDKDPDNECASGQCSGSGTCQYYNGLACTTTSQCLSGNCVDGMCCGAACTGTCQACSSAKKGSGFDGQCGNIKNATDPDNECTNGDCNGSGACTIPSNQLNGLPCSLATQCASGNCVDGVCCGGACTGTCQACSVAKKGSGYEGQCGYIQNATDPDNECATGDCNGSGACTTSGNTANGTACTSGATCASGNCADGVCCDKACVGTCEACTASKKGSGSDGTCGFIATNTNPDNECLNGKCNGAGACNSYNGVACTAGAQCMSNYCVDGVCCGAACTGACQACSVAKKGSGFEGQCGFVAANTDPDNECSAECNGSGACLVITGNSPNGTVCTTGSTCVSGNCVDGVCCDAACTGTCEACTAAKKGSGTDGTCGNIAADTNPDGECINGKCSGSGTCKYYNGLACTTAAQCLSGNCADGYCCGAPCTETCRACSAAKKGTGVNGVCEPIVINTDPDNECPTGECSGAGFCTWSSLNGAPCTTGSTCSSGSCVDGVCCNTTCTGTCRACTAAKKGSGADGTCSYIGAATDPDNECPTGECNGSGVCGMNGNANGTPCATGSTCVSGFCVDGVCCDTTCAGTCQACTAAKKGSGANGTCGNITAVTDPDNECNPGDCNGSGACASGNANGTVCTTGTSCTSGFCVDGVCCDAACTGTCQACTAAKKGSGVNGTCGSIAYDTNPDGECVSGKCSGTGSCQYYNGLTCTTGSECLSGNCVDGYCCGNVCAEKCMACSAAKKGGGSNGVCGAIASGTDPDNECFLDCSAANACVLVTNGNACGVNIDCASGHCVEGICCDTACTGLCSACSAAKKGSGANGTCGAIGSGLDPDNECNGAVSCSGTGTCAYFANGTVCSAGGECASGQCVDGVCCDSTCTGQCMACTGAKKGSGVDGTCGPIAVGTNPDNECAVQCNGAGACVLASDGTACAAGWQCLSGQCIDGVCCNTPCIDGCMSCIVAGSVGTCTETPPGACGAVCDDPAVFADVRTVPVAYEAGATAVGDLNGDGMSDLVVVKQYGSVIHVLMRTGNGTFAPTVDYAVNSSATAVLMVDVNNDGKLDLLTANGNSASVSVLMNNGNGTFAPKVDYVTATGPQSLAAADMNGDGKPDLAVGTTTATTVSILFNNGNGTFGAKNDYNVGQQVLDITAADMNGDGKADVAFTQYGNDNVCVLMNNGNSTFASKVEYAVNFSPRSVVATDVNGDGKNDLAVTTYGSMNILLNNGNGTFAPKVSYGSSSQMGGIASKDLNGDGKPDIVSGDYGLKAATVFLNNGNGTFGAPRNYHVGASTGTIAIGDLTGDGLPDLVTSNSSTAIGIVENKGAGLFIARRNYRVGSYFGKSIAADLNGDNKEDLITTTAESSDMLVYMNMGDGSFAPFVTYDMFGAALSVVAVDLDNDGDRDVAVANSISWGDMISTFLNNGDGTFAPRVDHTIYDYAQSMVAVELTGDGLVDLAITTSDFVTGQVTILVNVGNGNFATTNSYPLNDEPVAIDSADLNADGHPDLVVVNSGWPDYVVSVLMNNGNGTFASKVDYAAGSSPIAVSATDLTGDGHPDLAVLAQSSDSVGVFVNNGNGTFAPRIDYATGDTPTSIATIDVTGDGKRDIVVGHEISNYVSILVKDADGSFAPKVNYALPYWSTTGVVHNPVTVVGSDFDGNGKADLAVTLKVDQTFMMTVLNNITINACYP